MIRRYNHLSLQISKVPLAGYWLAVATTSLAALARLLLPSALAPAPYLGFYPAVVVSAALGGVGPGLVSCFGALILVYLFGNAHLHDPSNIARQVIWVTASVGVSLLAGKQRDARVRAEQTAEELRKSEERLRLAQEAASAGSWEWNPTTNENFWSEELWRVFGIVPHSCQPTYDAWLEIIHPYDRERVARTVRETAAKGAKLLVEWRVNDCHGTERWISSHGRPRFESDGRPASYVGIALDITARKKAEETLQRYELLVRHSRDIIFFLEYESGRLLEVNEAAINAYGYTKEELLALTIHDLRSEETLHLTAEQMAEAVSRGIRFETVHRRKDGSRFPVEVSSQGALIGQAQVVISVVHDITRRKQAEQKLQDLNAELEKRICERTSELASSMEMLKTESAERIKTVEELRKKDQMLIHQSRLAALGEMIGAIAHQWRQPLTTLGAAIQSVRMAWDRQKLDAVFLEKMEADAQKQLYYMSETIEDFRNFFNPEKVTEQFDVKQKIHKVVQLVSAQFAHANITLKISDNASDCPLTVEGCPNELKQSLLNLVSNAFDAIKAKGRQADGETGIVEISMDRAGDIVVIEVKDDGCGIPNGLADKIFEPYYTNKAEGKGSGIGLYMAKLIIQESMGGRLSYTSGLDGTVFRLELPLCVG